MMIQTRSRIAVANLLALLAYAGGAVRLAQADSQGSCSACNSACVSPPQGRLLLSGPATGGPEITEIHQFDLATRQRSVFATFQNRPLAMIVGQNGLLYVMTEGGPAAIYRLNRHTGALVDTLPITPYSPLVPYAMAELPGGNLLVEFDNGAGTTTIREYGADGADLGVWLGGIPIASWLKVSPTGTVCFAVGHAASGATKIVEYDQQAAFIREILPTSAGISNDDFHFIGANQLLVTDRITKCIKRFDLTPTPASFLGNVVCDPTRLGPNYSAMHPLNGSIFAFQVNGGCIHAWDAAGAPLYGGQPIATCYSANYIGVVLIIAEDCNNNDLEDRCEIAGGLAEDCNSNQLPDTCDIAAGRSTDCDSNQTPDECQPDGDDDGIIDACDNCPLLFNPNQADTDSDGTGDVCDGCSIDPNKAEPGVCGCGVADTIAFVGFLPPIGGADATGGSFADPLRAFRLGSTIPVKFSASQCGGPLLAGVHTLKAIKYSSVVDSDPPIDATPTDAATTGNQFRLADGAWHFNLSTRSGFSAGTWKLIATLSDGSTHYVWITIKK